MGKGNTGRTPSAELPVSVASQNGRGKHVKGKRMENGCTVSLFYGPAPGLTTPGADAGG